MTARLHPDDLERLADLVAERLIERLSAVETPRQADPAGTRVGHREAPREGCDPVFLSATEAARRLGVSPDWLRQHGARFGGIRVGDGPRPRWRFPAALIDAPTLRPGAAESGRTDPPAGTRDRAGTVTQVPGTSLDFQPARTLQPRPVPVDRPGGAPTPRAPATRRRPRRA